MKRLADKRSAKVRPAEYGWITAENADRFLAGGTLATRFLAARSLAILKSTPSH
jgi:hypothetical protein